MSGRTSNGSFRFATCWSNSLGSSCKPIPPSVMGRPTSVEKDSTCSSTERGCPSRTSCTSRPQEIFSPWTIVRGGRCSGQAVVNGMSSRKARGLEAQPGEQGIRLDQPFQGRGHDLCLHGAKCLGPIVQQRFIAELCQGQGALARTAPPHVPDTAFNARFRLEPRRQGITHPGRQQPRRSLRDDLGIDEHKVGVLAVEAIFLEYTILRVDDRKGTARCIARSHGRAIDHGQVEVRGDGPRGIQDLAAARTDDRTSLVLPGDLLGTLDLGMGAFAAEGMDDVFDPRFAQGCFPGVREESNRRFAGNDHRRSLQA